MNVTNVHTLKWKVYLLSLNLFIVSAATDKCIHHIYVDIYIPKTCEM